MSKFVRKTSAEFKKWCDTGNILAQSLLPYNKILTEFNSLTSMQRIEIQKEFTTYDQLRKVKIQDTECSQWLIGIMVDANIIACEYGINPLTVILCINPICGPNEKIFLK